VILVRTSTVRASAVISTSNEEKILSEIGLVSNEDVREALQTLDKQGVRDPKCKFTC